jgi:hypothetical protein
MRYIIAIIVSFVICLSANAQTPVDAKEYNGMYLVQTIIIDGDTIPVVTLRTASISDQRKARSKRYQRNYTKLYNNVIKTYPYAEVAGQLIHAYNENLIALKTETERQVYMEKCEEELKAEFEGDMRKMTVSQGRVLIKLIDRETGQTSYELIRQMRSGFTAFMWQGVAKFFGTNLKDNYDPESNENDALIEEIVLMIESGQIQVATRSVKTPAATEVLNEQNRKMQRRIEKEQKKLDQKAKS